jgi:hypothetical protein
MLEAVGFRKCEIFLPEDFFRRKADLFVIFPPFLGQPACLSRNAAMQEQQSSPGIFHAFVFAPQQKSRSARLESSRPRQG